MTAPASRTFSAPPRRISAELVSRVTLSLHELLENAVKHSRGKRAVFELRMDALDKRRLLLRTSNPATAANAKQVKALLRRLSRTTPQALYQELLLETSTREVGSGLGLVRIAAECGMVLSSSFDGKSLVMEAWNQPDPHEATHVSDSRG